MTNDHILIVKDKEQLEFCSIIPTYFDATTAKAHAERVAKETGKEVIIYKPVSKFVPTYTIKKVDIKWMK